MQDAGALKFPGKDSRKPPREVDYRRLFEALPPHSIEAEMALLGSMILQGDVTGDVLQIIDGPEDFFKPAHATIYAALVQLYDEVQAVDAVQLKEKLSGQNQLERVGGIDYVIRLAESTPFSSSAPHYANIVRDKAILRRLIEAAGGILQDCHDCEGPVNELVDKIETSIFELSDNKSEEAASSIGELLHETFERIEQNEGKVLSGLMSGFIDMDQMTNGMHPGEMIIVAARPSMGKTAFTLNLAEYMAATEGGSVGVFSLEMSKGQLAERMLCARSGVDSQKLRRNMFSQDEYKKLMAASGQLEQARLYIDDTPGLTLMGLRARARRMKQRYDVGILMIDYLQLMSAPSAGKDGRQNEVAAISRGIKALARELKVPVICLSQLNRAAEQREGHRPRMSDLRESGSIEQDADVVMMLHREDYYHRGDPEYIPDNSAEIIICKQRNGPTGTVKLYFDGATTSFRNYASG